MNIEIVKKYIESYKSNFNDVSTRELYKWKAVKQFQDNWNIDADDFYSMLDNSLKKVSNLMDSGSYFPKKMLVLNSKKQPEKIRTLFRNLFNEEINLIDRIKSFKYEFILLNQSNFVGLKDFQDDRAVVVYLSLRYPNQYYFYKFKMFKSFVEVINYPFKVKTGKLENVSQFINLCETLKPFLARDQTLLQLHNSRLTKDCFIDDSLNILTQDFIYASVKYLKIDETEINNNILPINVENIQSSELSVSPSHYNFNPSIIDHEAKNRTNKHIGNLGELFVMQYEIDKLRKANNPKLVKKVKHSAKDEGDGLGYDILSYDEFDNEMFIEVKTTKSRVNTTFYITRNELERSKKEKENYFIYRVFDFDETTLTGSLLIINGDTSNLCVEPINYKVTLK